MDSVLKQVFLELRNIKDIDVTGSKQNFEGYLNFFLIKHKICNDNEFLSHVGDIIIGFYSDTDIEFDLELIDIDQTIEYKLKAKEFTYTPDILHRYSTLLHSKVPESVWVIYGFLHRDIVSYFRDLKYRTALCDGEYLNYHFENKPVIDKTCYIPPFYFEQKEENRIKKEFTKEDGLRDELMAVVWHPDNYHKFKGLL